MGYIVKSPLNHDGVAYKIGDSFGKDVKKEVIENLVSMEVIAEENKAGGKDKPTNKAGWIALITEKGIALPEGVEKFEDLTNKELEALVTE